MRIFNRAHVPWAIFVLVATLFASWLYIGNFDPETLPSELRPPSSFIQTASENRRVGGTPLGLTFGTIALSIFIFAALLGVRKKLVLWRVGTVQRWLRAHIWLTLLTIPLVILHSGFRLGGPMTTLLVVLYVIVMVSGVYGLVLQHQMPRIMMERLPAESVYEQIPHIRGQLLTAAQKMRDSFKPAPPKPDAGAPPTSPEKVVTAGSTPMASTAAELITPTARAKTVVGSTITAEPVVNPAAPASATPVAAPAAPRVILPAEPPPPKPADPAPKPIAATATSDVASEAALLDFLDRQILPYLAARRGSRYRLGNARFSEDTFRFVKLRVTEPYRTRVEEIQAWCDERRMLDLQAKLHHWMHGWLFVHAPISFLLLMLTFWHAFVTLFYY